MFKLKSNWWEVLRYAWSVRLIVLAGLLQGLEVAIPYLDGYVDVPPRLFAGLSLLVTAGAFWARLVAQKGVSDAAPDQK